ncbi:BTAD domain-containing putative transcriptional regulator [Cellulosimicrobium arenosum]|uniref:AAA family ATPase n=1 Tax=Cellulosimicrobium arenosum TaxID=2708133 RepID=A0A927G7Y3_9MICO|nr:AAA family ATPase [Cellulosimicrobium arenosum]
MPDVDPSAPVDAPAEASCPPTAPLVRVLGPVRVPGPAGASVAPRGPRAAALVVALALAGGRAVSAGALVDDLWGLDVPQDPRAALQSLVSRLRRDAVPGLVVSQSGGYTLGVPSDLDVARRALLTARAATTGGTGAGDGPGADVTGALRDAVELWPDGDPGADVPGAVGHAIRTEAARLHAELTLAWRTAAVRAGDHATVARLAGEAVAQDETDEPAALDLMGALDGLGRRPDALRTYTRLRSALVRELGSEPGPETVALHDRLAAAGREGGRSRTAGAGPTDVPARRTPPPPRRGHARGVRSYPTTLLGREDDVVAVAAALETSRLVTVLGPGGLGKTRLAQEVARRAVGQDDLVVVVELVGVRTDDDVVLALADALGVVPAGGSVRLGDRLQAGDVADQVAERLRDQRALVVLDNCEHVVEGAARWTGRLLDVSEHLRVLATSRTPLLLEAERTYAPAPLGSGGGEGDGPAVRLFTERARAVRPEAVVDRAVVARLCERLDGLPLAIELAAARVRTLGVAEIEARLDERFALLRARDRSVPDRHRTLEAVLEWSWNLLETRQQVLWRRAALLPDGFSPDAARALVAGTPGWQVDDDVDALVLQSLVRVEETDGATRYRMVETVREFGLLRLGTAREETAVVGALLDWSTTVARRCAARLLGPEQNAAMVELAQEQENLLFTVRRAVQRGRPDVVVHGFVALLGSWALRGAEDRIGSLVPAVLDSLVGWDVPEDDADATAIALEVIAATSIFGMHGGAARPLARLRRLLRSSHGVGRRTRELAELVLAGSPEEVLSVLARLQRSDDGYLALIGYMFEAQQRENDGQLARAVELATASHAAARRVGDVAATMMTAAVVASFVAEQGDALAARRWIATAKAEPGVLGVAELHRQVDWIELCAALSLGDVDGAESALGEMESALAGRDDAAAVEATAVVELGRGEIAWLRDDHQGALRHLTRAIDALGPGTPRGDNAPWFLLLSSSTLVRRVQAGVHEGGLVRRIVEVGGALRGTGRGFVDRPVLATSCVGVAAWACLGGGAGSEVPGPPVPEAAERVRLGVELLVLAARLGAREDLPALRHDALRGAVARAGHADLLAEADRTVVALTDDTLVGRADDLLARLGEEAGQAFFM